MDPGTLNLTPAFPGEQPKRAIAGVHEALTGLRAEAFNLTVQGPGTFGSRQPAPVGLQKKGGEGCVGPG